MRQITNLRGGTFRRASFALVPLLALLTLTSAATAQGTDGEQTTENATEYYPADEPESQSRSGGSSSQGQSSADWFDDDYLCQGQRTNRGMQRSAGAMGGSSSEGNVSGMMGGSASNGQGSQDEGSEGEQEDDDSQPQEPPDMTAKRWDEDYSYLCDFSNRTGAWWERFKFIPLDSRGRVYLTLGDELRLRYVTWQNNEWGAATLPDEDYFRYRQMPYADLHIGPHFRLFGQLIIAYSTRADLTKNPEVDETGVDLMQGFADIKVPLDNGGELTIRGGREIMAYGDQRLISTGPNIPFAFDGGLIRLDQGDTQVDAFYKHPVEHDFDSFDDRPDPTRAIWALYATRMLPQISDESGVDLYYIGFEDDEAAWNQGEGHENRQTFGTRIFGTYDSWSWNFEHTIQVGNFAGADVWAWSNSGEVQYQFEDVRLEPTLGLRGLAVSGDDNPNDDSLETFNALFTNAQYFGDIGLLGPVNLYALRGFVLLDLGSGWTFETAGYAFWRQSLGDGIYGQALNLVRPDGGSDERFIGSQADFVLGWQVNRNLNFRGVYSLFWPGPFIEDTGPAETVQFVQLDMVFKW